MVAAVTPDFGRGAVARVVAGMQRRLQRRGYLLALTSLDTAPNVAVQLQQRGIEGVIAIDATLPRQLELPVASVDLSYMLSLEPLTDGMQAWLSELGESAAETIIRQIERQSVSRRVKVDAKVPPAYFELPNVHMGSSAVARESA
jgi:DNA-binding LacI/PurR family transcriptional regulator